MSYNCSSYQSKPCLILQRLGIKIKGEVSLVLPTMGVGVEAPGRDHHSMTSPTEQSHNMTNGFNSDNHGRNSGGKYKIIY